MYTELTEAQMEKAERIVRARIRLTADYTALLTAALRFTASIHGGKHSQYYAEREREYQIEPENLLTIHSHVMNAKSARSVTLRRLADSVIKQAELPMKPAGHYRGMDYILDWEAVNAKWRDQE